MVTDLQAQRMKRLEQRCERLEGMLDTCRAMLDELGVGHEPDNVVDMLTFLRERSDGGDDNG